MRATPLATPIWRCGGCKARFPQWETDTYLLGWNLDSDLLDGLGELIRLDGTVVIQIKVFESLLKNGLFRLGALGLLSKFVFQFSLETTESKLEWCSVPLPGWAVSVIYLPGFKVIHCFVYLVKWVFLLFFKDNLAVKEYLNWIIF